MFRSAIVYSALCPESPGRYFFILCAIPVLHLAFWGALLCLFSKCAVIAVTMFYFLFSSIFGSHVWVFMFSFVLGVRLGLSVLRH